MISLHIEPFGHSATLHHVGLVVPSIHAQYPDLEITFDPIQKVGVAFFHLHGVRVELIEPKGEDSPVQQSLRKGTKLVHMCYEVEDLEQVMIDCAKEGFRCIAKPVPAVAFDGRNIAWVFHRVLGLFELLQR
jgi:methylmalonyl-CoA/ethylmalonyl-CoA epimerase